MIPTKQREALAAFVATLSEEEQRMFCLALLAGSDNLHEKGHRSTVTEHASRYYAGSAFVDALRVEVCHLPKT